MQQMWADSIAGVESLKRSDALAIWRAWMAWMKTHSIFFRPLFTYINLLYLNFPYHLGMKRRNSCMWNSEKKNSATYLI